METHGKLTLSLKYRPSSGGIGEFKLTLLPGDKDYQTMLAHIGGIAPGETKPVPPFDD